MNKVVTQRKKTLRWGVCRDKAPRISNTLPLSLFLSSSLSLSFSTVLLFLCLSQRSAYYLNREILFPCRTLCNLKSLTSWAQLEIKVMIAFLTAVVQRGCPGSCKLLKSPLGQPWPITLTAGETFGAAGSQHRGMWQDRGTLQSIHLANHLYVTIDIPCHTVSDDGGHHWFWCIWSLCVSVHTCECVYYVCVCYWIRGIEDHQGDPWWHTSSTHPHTPLTLTFIKLFNFLWSKWRDHSYKNENHLSFPSAHMLGSYCDTVQRI